MFGSRNITPRHRASTHVRAMLWSLGLIVAAAMALPTGAYLYASFSPAQAQGASSEESNPRANYWRAVRGGLTGYSAVSGQETNVLIQNGGQNWRKIRNGPLATYGGWFLFAAVILIMAFFAMRGRIEIEGGRSGVTVKRWSAFNRALHWYTAILFIILAVSGLSLLFGKKLLIPLLGAQGFAGYANFAISAHNFLGPFFAVGALLMIVLWIRHNLPSKGDLKWFLSGGGLIGKGHASAGRMNAGEKVWFWLICTVGVAVCVTGLVLIDFPNQVAGMAISEMGYTRETMQYSSIIHAGLAILWIAAFFGHAYIGSIGSEGSLEAMSTGRVDANWAMQHHDLWYDEVKGGAQTVIAPRPRQKMPEDSVLRRHYESMLRMQGASA